METIFFFAYKTTYLNEEVNRTEPSSSVRVPWPNLKLKTRPCVGRHVYSTCLLVATNKRIAGIFRRTRANGSVIDNFAQSIGAADADTGVRALLPYAGQLRGAV